MPKIIGQKEQQDALKEIKKAVKEMENINAFLNAKDFSGQYTISFTDDKGKKLSATAYIEKKEDIERFIVHNKAKISSHIADLAEKNRIALDIDEKMTLDIPLTAEELKIYEEQELEKILAEEAAKSTGNDSQTNADVGADDITSTEDSNAVTGESEENLAETGSEAETSEAAEGADDGAAGATQPSHFSYN